MKGNGKKGRGGLKRSNHSDSIKVYQCHISFWELLLNGTMAYEDDMKENKREE